MADTVTIAGHAVKKKPLLIGGGIGVVAGIAVYVRHKNAAAVVDPTGDATTTSDPSQDIDPATGFPNGSADDLAQLAQFDETGLPSTSSGGGGGDTGVSGPTGFTSNGQWAQAAEQAMGSSGSDAIAAALGKYLTGAEVTADQVTHIQQAIAIENYPPVAGPNGFPPAYHAKATAPAPPPPANKPTKEVAADGKDTLRDIAAHSGTTTYAQAQKLNPWAHRFTTKTKPIPKGYKVKVYK